MLAPAGGPTARVEVVETALGVPLGELLRLGELPAQAVLVGGYHGAWLTSGRAATLTLGNAGCAQPARPSAPGCSPPARTAGAASPRRPGSCATWPLSRPGSAGPASTACPASPPRWPSWPAPGRTPAPRRPEPLGRAGRSRGACHHPDGTSASCAAPCPSSATSSPRTPAAVLSHGHRPFLPRPRRTSPPAKPTGADR